jgi:hypothetical protein
MKKLKILSLPKYDDVTDSFIDGPLPKSADSFFANNEKMKEFFEVKKFKPHIEEEPQHH